MLLLFLSPPIIYFLLVFFILKIILLRSDLDVLFPFLPFNNLSPSSLHPFPTIRLLLLKGVLFSFTTPQQLLLLSSTPLFSPTMLYKALPLLPLVASKSILVSFLLIEDLLLLLPPLLSWVRLLLSTSFQSLLLDPTSPISLLSNKLLPPCNTHVLCLHFTSILPSAYLLLCVPPFLSLIYFSYPPTPLFPFSLRSRTFTFAAFSFG